MAYYAKLVGISEQAARKRMRIALQTKLNSHVRQIHGRGGRGGKQYEVHLSSLPEHLQKAFRALSETDDACAIVAQASLPACIPVPAANQSAKIAERWRILEPISHTKPRSPERTEAKREACRIHGIPKDTLDKWVSRAEQSGWNVNAMAHQRPSNAGKSRMLVSYDFDKAFRAMGGDEETLHELAEELARLIKAAWASPAQRAGFKAVRLEAVTAFKRHCRELGIAIPDKVKISDRTIKQASSFRIVDIEANDRKGFDDMKPRIRRDNSKFLPMAQIVMDVKPLDNIVLRPDGSQGWPRMIAFQCVGTMRIFPYIVLLNKGEGVRQEHVIEAFLAMVSHPDWGFPQQLYRDNGSEFAVFDMIREGLALIAEEGARTSAPSKRAQSSIARLTSGVRKWGQDVRKVSNDITSGARSLEHYERRVRRLRQVALGTFFRAAGQQARRFAADLRLGIRNLDLMGRAGRGAKAGLGWLGGKAMGLAKWGAAAGAAAGGLAMFDLFRTAGQFEQYQVQLEVLLGSAAKAKRGMSWIQNFAQTTPFELDQVTQAFVVLKNAGLDPTNGLLRSTGDAAAGMSSDVVEAAKAVADAANGQFERLIDLGITASTQGDKVRLSWVKNGKDIEKVASKADKVGLAMAVAAAWSDKFAGSSDRQSKTLFGIINNLKDKWSGFLLMIAEAGIFDKVKAKLEQWLTRAIGRESAQVLCDKHGGDTIRVPLARELRAEHYRSQGLSYAAIAARLGLTEGGVRTLFKRLDQRN